jgi:membrane fusion protein, epimerase transport system
VPTSMEVPKRIGLFIFILVFGFFGSWAALAPTDGAAHAPGVVTVRSYSKLVQHLEGGIVGEILVQDGDRVTAGQPLLVLDNTQSQAQVGIANSQYVALKATESRLLAERDSLEAVNYPVNLSRADSNAQAEMEAQSSIFQTRKSALEGGIDVLEQRIEQLQSQLVGLRALRASKEELAASYADELMDIEDLLSQGFSDKIRLRDAQRRLSTYQGEAADLTATIAATEVQIGETRLQIIQQEREFQNEVANRLSETQTQLKDISERVNALNYVLSRTVVKAPVAGVVNGMQVHTVGGVIGPGSTIAEIVPQSEELIVEARVSIVDIDRVAPGEEATIRFSSFGNRTPTVFGDVLNISADSLQDPNTGASYYLARVEVSPDGMESLHGLVLVPGMPAEVLIASGSRTLLQYLFKPFSNVMARSFIED